MGSKMVRLEEHVYERIESAKRDDETFSEAVDRLTGDYSLLDLAGGYSGGDAERHRELLERAEGVAKADRKARLERLDALGEPDGGDGVDAGDESTADNG